MIARLAILALVVAAAPAAAADISTTHEEVFSPPGKGIARAYRPIAQPIGAQARDTRSAVEASDSSQKAAREKEVARKDGKRG